MLSELQDDEPELQYFSDSDTSDFETISSTPFSTISRTLATIDASPIPQVVAVKMSSLTRRWAKEPHDIVREGRVLASLAHPNVIELIDTSKEARDNTLSLWMPYVPYSLDRFLDLHLTPDSPTHILILAKSIQYQIFNGVSYLHANGVAHRDIKPSNILITSEGVVKLIDFGVCWAEQSSSGDLFPEMRKRGDEGKGLYFEVCTGPYRPPELLFGTRDYDPYAVDMWSIGCVLAEFYTPFQFNNETRRKERQALFNAPSELGLIWSIFSQLGTPTNDVWPGWEDLPDAGRVQWTVVPPKPLADALPHLPTEAQFHPLEVIENLLVYPPEKRHRPGDSLSLEYFKSEGVVLPIGYGDGTGVNVYEGYTLGDILQESLDVGNSNNHGH